MLLGPDFAFTFGLFGDIWELFDVEVNIPCFR